MKNKKILIFTLGCTVGVIVSVGILGTMIVNKDSKIKECNTRISKLEYQLKEKNNDIVVEDNGSSEKTIEDGSIVTDEPERNLSEDTNKEELKESTMQKSQSTTKKTENVVNEEQKNTGESQETTQDKQTDTNKETKTTSEESKTSGAKEEDRSNIKQAAENTTIGNTSNTITVGQKNALSSAKSYLSIMSFSREGLIKQLKYEGYTSEEATYGVDNCGANWNEQAAKMAKQYTSIMSFSKSELIKQLEHDGFTASQAEYGVSAAGY